MNLINDLLKLDPECAARVCEHCGERLDGNAQAPINGYHKPCREFLETMACKGIGATARRFARAIVTPDSDYNPNDYR